MIQTSQCVVQFPPENLDFEKWQKLTNMMAKLYNASSGVIVQLRDDVFNVASTSENSDNFLNSKSQWPWDMKSFCRRLVETGDKLYVNDAENSEQWSDAPPVCDGPVRSYLGYPIYWPDGSIFGSFCVIDTKATDYQDSLIEILEQLKLIVESDLRNIFDTAKIKLLLAEKITSEKLIKQESDKNNLISESLKIHESISTATLASLREAVIRFNDQGDIVSCNQATENLFGHSMQTLVGKPISLLVDGIANSNKQHEQKLLLSPSSRKLTSTSKQADGMRSDGSSFPINLAVTEILLGAETQHIALISDISEKVEHENLLKQLALFDPLTNCANRNLLKERFEYLANKYSRDNTPFSLMYLDLNAFKPVNDNYGHNYGDEVLAEFSQRLKSAVRAHDLVARVGGDEFVILFNNLVNLDKLKEKIKNIASQPYHFDNFTIELSASVGSANFPNDGDTMTLILEQADKLMYKDKANLER